MEGIYNTFFGSNEPKSENSDKNEINSDSEIGKLNETVRSTLLAISKSLKEKKEKLDQIQNDMQSNRDDGISVIRDIRRLREERKVIRQVIAVTGAQGIAESLGSTNAQSINDNELRFQVPSENPNNTYAPSDAAVNEAEAAMRAPNLSEPLPDLPLSEQKTLEQGLQGAESAPNESPSEQTILQQERGLQVGSASDESPSAEAPTDSPAEAPTDSPAEAPTDSPAEAPTDSPAEAPTDSPPAKAPAEAPAESPAEAPAESPAESPPEKPVVRPGSAEPPQSNLTPSKTTLTPPDSEAGFASADDGESKGGSRRRKRRGFRQRSRRR